MKTATASTRPSKVFLDKLSWPTAVICYGGGVFIGDPPDIIYAKDTDGDGVADVKQVIYTGFSRKNVQGMMNTFCGDSIIAFTARRARPAGRSSALLWDRCEDVVQWKIENRKG